LDFLQDMLKDKSGDLLARLTGGADFSPDVAEKFIPEAASATMDAVKSESANLDMADFASPGNVSSVMGGIDVSALADKVGISSDQTSNGLTAILPTVLGLISSKAGGAGGLGTLLGLGGGLGGALGGGLGGATDKLKGMGGKLFG